MTKKEIAERLASVREHIHALTLHQDILTNDEEHDHAWNLACAIDELDRELNGWQPDAYLGKRVSR